MLFRSLKTLNGDPLPGTFSARHLRRFFPKEGTKLAEEQKALEAEAMEGEPEGERGVVEEEHQHNPTPDTTTDD